MRQVGEKICARIKETNFDDATSLECAIESYFVASPGNVRATGRIVCELDETASASSSSRINLGSVLLESEEGHLTRLDLTKVAKQLFIVPGEIVIVEGINRTGQCIEVDAIHDDARCVHSEDTPELNPTQDMVASQNRALDIIVAAGPFTSSRNFQFRPLDELLNRVRSLQPDLLILVGPFIDASHQLMKDELNFNITFEEIFHERVVLRISKALEAIKTHCLMVPSLADVHHHYVFPQPPFDQNHLPTITMLGNPASARVGSLNIGITSSSVLEDISAESISLGQDDRISAMVGKLLRQQTYYPLFPPGVDVPLDTTLWNSVHFDPKFRPDLLIVTSKLKPFAKQVSKSTVCVNPGSLCRGERGGTFARTCWVTDGSLRESPLIERVSVKLEKL
uniref:DNA polymerase alpha subunit B n=1 Tax=Compsopogon caeruleus TaxID=31354 RepID=A0A7S1TIJ8_9RHOD|mmetsp:Transcript_8330/g.16981  ORF Transcript_8330/g.16981 Transcript_8330/m.16981 type:complete len:396 (+) Transcript_8330:1-1188(+)